MERARVTVIIAENAANNENGKEKVEYTKNEDLLCKSAVHLCICWRIVVKKIWIKSLHMYCSKSLSFPES